MSQAIFTDQERNNKISRVIQRIDKLYQEYVSKNHIPGCGYAIVADGKIVHANYVGYANVEKKIPVTAKTVFRIASLSKSFTAMGILRLRDAGKRIIFARN